MYNKLILKNESEGFTIVFDGQDHYVPTGLFEVEEVLGNFIVGQAGKWKLNVTRISKPEPPKVTKIEEKLIEISEEKAEEIKVEAEKAVAEDVVTDEKTGDIKVGKKRGLNFKL